MSSKINSLKQSQQIKNKELRELLKINNLLEQRLKEIHEESQENSQYKEQNENLIKILDGLVNNKKEQKINYIKLAK